MKIILSESQLKRIKSRLNEGVGDSYSKEINLSFNAYGLNLRGYEINYINSVKATVKFQIEIEARQYGIKDISIYSIVGPETVEVDVDYYNENDEEASLTIPLNIDWSNAIINKLHNGTVTVDDEIEVNLGNDAQANLFVKSIEVTVYSL
jgi:hypothetical protein